MSRSLPLLLALLWLAQQTLAADADGESLYRANCAECHQRDGQGISTIYPALDGSEVVTGSGIDVALVMLIGRGEMPSFDGALSNAEIAAIINYLRNAWSNQSQPGSAVTAEQIGRLQ